MERVDDSHFVAAGSLVKNTESRTAVRNAILNGVLLHGVDALLTQ